MVRAYNVVDADGHILEPLDLWERYMDPAFRDRAPRIVKDNATGRRGGSSRSIRATRGSVSAGSARSGQPGPHRTRRDGLQGRQARRFRPACAHPDIDADGIDVAFLYPSIGLFSGAIHDPQLAAAVCRA